MRELKLTGWMSNRGRQNVASFLTKDLGLDWRLGAEWFESQLVSRGVIGKGGGGLHDGFRCGSVNPADVHFNRHLFVCDTYLHTMNGVK